MTSNETINIFTIQFIQSIERAINVFIKEQDIVVPSQDILPVIYKIISSIKSNPKFEHILNDSDTIQDKILSILKKYLADVNANTGVNSITVPSIDNDPPEKIPSGRVLGMEKILLLDSGNRTYTGTSTKDVLQFKFKNIISVKDFNVDCISFTTKIVMNDPYVLVYIKQLPTTTFYDHSGGLGCYAKLLLDRVVHHNDMTTYYYKNPDMNVINPNAISLEELAIKFVFPNSKCTPGIDVYSIDEMSTDTIKLATRTETIRVNDRLRLLSEDTTVSVIDVTEVNKDEKTILKYNSDSGGDITTYDALENTNHKIVITMKFL